MGSYFWVLTIVFFIWITLDGPAEVVYDLHKFGYIVINGFGTDQ